MNYQLRIDAGDGASGVFGALLDYFFGTIGNILFTTVLGAVEIIPVDVIAIVAQAEIEHTKHPDNPDDEFYQFYHIICELMRIRYMQIFANFIYSDLFAIIICEN